MQQLSIIFVCEFITGGGLHGMPLPQCLLAEGLLMRDALLRDLSALPYHVLTTCDSRVGASVLAQTTITMEAGCDVWQQWDACIQRADYVWLVAPETDGALYKLTAMATRHGKTVIGSGLQAIEIAASKYLTCMYMRACGIATIPTWTYSEWQAQSTDDDCRWIAKPDDGAGCNDTFIFEGVLSLSQWFERQLDRQHTHVIQPYLRGIAASLCIVSKANQVHILSYNLQQLQLQGQRLIYTGGVVNGALEYRAELDAFALKLQHCFPTLTGYYGVDVLLQAQSSTKTDITLIEINPRLTTTYTMLANAMQVNPAKLILEVMLDASAASLNYQHGRVAFGVHDEH